MKEIQFDQIGPQIIGKVAVGYDQGWPIAGTILGYEIHPAGDSGQKYATIYFDFIPDRGSNNNHYSASVSIGAWLKNNSLFIV